MSDPRTLNLDELFGTARPVVVELRGKRYELVRPEGLTPVQHQNFIRLYSRIETMQLNTETDPNQLDMLMNELIGILNASLAKAKLSYVAKIKVLEFYNAEVLQDQGETKADRKNSTGA